MKIEQSDVDSATDYARRRFRRSWTFEESAIRSGAAAAAWEIALGGIDPRGPLAKRIVRLRVTDRLRDEGVWGRREASWRAIFTKLEEQLGREPTEAEIRATAGQRPVAPPHETPVPLVETNHDGVDWTHAVEERRCDALPENAHLAEAGVAAIWNLVDSIGSRESEVLRRHVAGETLLSIGRSLGVTESRACQLLAVARSRLARRIDEAERRERAEAGSVRFATVVAVTGLILGAPLVALVAAPSVPPSTITVSATQPWTAVLNGPANRLVHVTVTTAGRSVSGCVVRVGDSTCRFGPFTPGKTVNISAPGLTGACWPSKPASVIPQAGGYRISGLTVLTANGQEFFRSGLVKTEAVR